jgi:hypothetical protein
VLGSLIVSGIGAVYLAPLVQAAPAAMSMMVTFYSILSGFLIAILAIIGDPAIVPGGSWRVAELSRKVIEKRFLQHKILFFLYLFTLAGIFTYSLLPSGGLGFSVFEWCILTLAIFTFLLSLLLPQQFIRVHMERIDNLIDERRGQA